MLPPLLFSTFNIFDILQNQEQALKAEVNKIDAATLEGVAEEELVHHLAGKYKLEMPILEDDSASTSYREVDVDISHDPMRLMIFGDTGSAYVKGTEITVSVPFKGDADLFQVRPTQFTHNPPRADVGRHEIRLIYTRTDTDAAALKSEYERTLAAIKEHLGWLETSVNEFNSKVGQQVQVLLAQRKQQVLARAGMVAALGLPIKQQPTAAPKQPRASKAVAKSIGSPKKWDVFISHASEDKEAVARPLATALEKKGISVWYDEFSLKMGDSLRGSIDFGLANSRYGVVILSKNFFAKHWTVQELNGLATREVTGKKVILPVWHQVTFDEVAEFSPMLADKLAAKSEQGIDAIVDQIISALEQD